MTASHLTESIRPMEWPAWVSSEDADQVWVRHDAPADTMGEVLSCVGDGGRYVLVHEYDAPMVRTFWGDSWSEACGWNYYDPLLWEADGADPQEAVLYRRFTVDDAPFVDEDGAE